MSYCRWSTDNFKCDLYAYESCHGGFVIHVASGKITTELPPDPYMLVAKQEITHDEFSRLQKEWQEAFDSAESEPIGLPYDEEMIHCETLEEFRDKLVELKNLGYCFPDSVIETVEEEIKEQP